MFVPWYMLAIICFQKDRVIYQRASTWEWRTKCFILMLDRTGEGSTSVCLRWVHWNQTSLVFTQCTIKTKHAKWRHYVRNLVQHFSWCVTMHTKTQTVKYNYRLIVGIIYVVINLFLKGKLINKASTVTTPKLLSYNFIFIDIPGTFEHFSIIQYCY